MGISYLTWLDLTIEPSNKRDLRLLSNSPTPSKSRGPWMLKILGIWPQLWGERGERSSAIFGVPASFSYVWGLDTCWARQKLPRCGAATRTQAAGPCTRGLSIWRMRLSWLNGPPSPAPDQHENAIAQCRRSKETSASWSRVMSASCFHGRSLQRPPRPFTHTTLSRCFPCSTSDRSWALA